MVIKNQEAFLQYILLILLIVVVQIESTFSQPRYQQDDIVTWADSRDVNCVDISPDVVWVATDGGLWRFSRYTGKALDPWFVGVGVHEAIPLRKSKVVLWQESSSRLWVATDKELLYWRLVARQWVRLESNYLIDRRIKSLGEMGDKIVVELTGRNGKFLVIDTFSELVEEIETLPNKEIRWTGSAGSRLGGFPHYYPNDFSLNFNQHDGSITDWERNVFKPVFERYDERTGIRYICYRKLGLAVVSEMQKRFDVLQLGPSGSDVKAMAFSDDGKIWTCGINTHQISGFSTFNRRQGNWSSYNSKLIVGLDSHSARDVLIIKNNIFFATDMGLARYDISIDKWKMLDHFDGFKSNNLKTLTLGGGFLLVGSDNGLNRYTLPNGPVWQISYETAIGFNTNDIVTDSKSLWVIGELGAFRIPVARTPEKEAEVLELGDELCRAATIVDDKIWIASQSGVRSIDLENGTDAAHFGYHGYLECKNATALAGNGKYLWIGTTGGLIRYDHHSSRRLEFGKKEGLPHDLIQSLALEADSLWIGTPAGLTRLIWNRPERDGD
ncbi:hypothetical protein K9N50_06235 [bacterium]|nr:hypothetical protein [bacterium]